MKAISLNQPFASLIAQGLKPYETRNWAPPESLIGHRIAIHATKAASPRALYAEQMAAANRFGLKFEDLPFGVVVCTARIVAAHKMGGSASHLKRMGSTVNERLQMTECSIGDVRGDDRLRQVHALEDPYYLDFVRDPAIVIDEYGDYSAGRWAWRLIDIEILDPPVPARGRQGIWAVEL